MNFDKALWTELLTIPEFTKVFGLVAPQETAAPFCVYNKVNVKHKKVMSGTLCKAECIYEIAVISKYYDQLQELANSTKNLLLSFLGRNIATTGPLIENVTVEEIGDQYEEAIGAYRANLRLTAQY